MTRLINHPPQDQTEKKDKVMHDWFNQSSAKNQTEDKDKVMHVWTNESSFSKSKIKERYGNA